MTTITLIFLILAVLIVWAGVDLAQGLDRLIQEDIDNNMEK